MSASGRSVCPPGPGGEVSPPSSPRGRCDDNDSDNDDNDNDNHYDMRLY